MLENPCNEDQQNADWNSTDFKNIINSFFSNNSLDDNFEIYLILIKFCHFYIIYVKCVELCILDVWKIGDCVAVVYFNSKMKFYKLVTL